MPTCLITGGAGFIGSHLATHLLQRGWIVRVLDDFSAGKPENLAHIAGEITLHEGSILDRDILNAAVKGADVVFHHAAMVSVPQSIAVPDRCHAICATGTLNVLLAARDARVRRLVYAASSSAYGNVEVCPIAESAPVCALSPYAAAKLAGEHYCTAFSETTSLETVRLRYFNVFGPRQDPSSPYSGVISIFCTKMLAGMHPTIFGDGRQTRDFVPVQNVVQANRLAAETSGAAGRVFNIGSGQCSTLLQLVASMNRILGTHLEPQFAPPRAGDVRHSQADIALARKLLGYQPACGLDDGLAGCVDYYRSLAANP